MYTPSSQGVLGRFTLQKRAQQWAESHVTFGVQAYMCAASKRVAEAFDQLHSSRGVFTSLTEGQSATVRSRQGARGSRV